MAHGALGQAVAEALAGATGGLVVVTLLAPLDLVKVRLQARLKAAAPQDGTSHAGTPTALAVLKVTTPLAPPTPPPTSSQYTQEALSEGGVAALFTGYKAKAVQVVVQDTTFYFWFAALKSTIGAAIRGYIGDAGVSMLCGAAAGAINILMTLPLEVVTTKLQTQAAQAEGYFATLRDVARREGLPGLWRGLLPSLVLTSNPALQFMAFDTIMKAAARRQGATTPPGAGTVFCLAAVAKAFALCVTYPLIRTKVVMMARHKPEKAQQEAATAAEPSATATQRLRRSMAHVLSFIVHTEGVLGLYRGLGAQLTKTVLGAALVMLLKERLTSTMQRLVLYIVRLLSPHTAARRR